MITTGFWIGIGLFLACVFLIVGIMILSILGDIVMAITEALVEVFKKEREDKREGF